MNISEFMTWFLSEFYMIGTNILSRLDQIIIYGNITLMQFIITITIIGILVDLLVVAPNLGLYDRLENATRIKKAKKESKK